MTPSFPKIIWQTHNHKEEWLPEHLKQVKATWINLNPGWDYRYVDQVQRDQMVSHYPEIYEVYKYQLPIPQADIWRYVVTYEEGGCYADMDSVCIKPLDFMLQGIDGDPEMIVVPEHREQGNNHNFITKAKSPIMESIVDQMRNKIRDSYLNIFINTVYSNENVSKLFTAASHSLQYKRAWVPDSLMINYYGENIKYTDFLEQNGLSLTT